MNTARELSEKALSQGLGQPTLLALSQTIQAGRKMYYQILEQSNKDMNITTWLLYLADTFIQAQNSTLRLIDSLITKTHMFNRLRGQVNDRQNEVLVRMFREGPDGFHCGMNAEKYIAITDATRATTTRDLADLVSKKALPRTGVRNQLGLV